MTQPGEDGRRFYADFSRRQGRGTGGSVGSEPTRRLEPSAFAGLGPSELASAKQAIDREKERQGAEIRLLLAMTTELTPVIAEMQQDLRETLFATYAPRPGFVQLDRNYYTGWFYAETQGQVVSVHRNVEQEGMPLMKGDEATFSPYYVAEWAAIEPWHARMREGKQRPLTVEEMKEVAKLSRGPRHPLFAQMDALPIDRKLRWIQAYVENLPIQKDETRDEEEQRQFVRKNIIVLSVLPKLVRGSRGPLQHEVVRRMVGLGITVFPLDGALCVLTYQARGGNIQSRRLPVPSAQRDVFERYVGLGQRYMYPEEIQEAYLKYVDPDSDMVF